MTQDPNHSDQARWALPWDWPMGAVLLLSSLALAACGDVINYARDGRSINTRDCTEWRTDSIAGCYDGQGGNGKN